MTYYDESHSITFSPVGSTDPAEARNTWKNWFLIPSSRPDVSSPGIDAKYITVPGRHGAIDITEYLTGEPVLSNRTGSWEFLIDNDHKDWYELRHEILNYLHGKKMKCVLNDEDSTYYIGRFTVDPKSGESNSTISITYNLEPYKYGKNWLWDPFNFETDFAPIEKSL